MTRLVNGILIGAVTFIAALALISVAAPRLQTDGARAPAGLDATVTDVRWDADRNGTPSLVIDLQVDAEAAARPASVALVTFEASVDGRILDEGSQSFALPIEEAGQSLQVGVVLPDDFASRWWAAYLEDGEASGLRVSGMVHVQQESTTRYVPFQWRSSWVGALLPSLMSGAHNCGNASGLCLAEASLEAASNGLQAELTLETGQNVTVRNGSVEIVLDGHVVAAGQVPGTTPVPAGRPAHLAATLASNATALDAWWADHARRCESSPATLNVQLVVARPVADGETEVIQVQWQFPAPAYHSGFVCNHG